MSNSRPARRNVPLGTLCLCTSLLSLGVGQAARAAAPLRTAPSAPVTITMPPAPAGSAIVDARSDRARGSAPLFGPSKGWTNRAISTASDGSSYSVWRYSDGTMAEWGYDTVGNASLEGPTYGPYSDVNNTTWAPVSIGVNPDDDTARILWNRSDGAAGIWTMDIQGNETSIGPTYGPYAGWTAIGIATANDGTSNLLWRRSDGAMSQWVMYNNGYVSGTGPTYGPYTAAGGTWAPVAIGADPADDTSRILWERSDGVVGVWIMDINGNYVGGGTNTYGPYGDSGGNWNPVGIATANDGTSALIWARDDGAGRPEAGGVWSLDADVNVTNVGPVYGPYGDGGGYWAPSPYGNGIGINPSDDTTRVLWDRSDGASGLWTLNVSGVQTAVGPVYGPYPTK